MKYKQAIVANFTKGRSDRIKFIVVHYTANNGDTASGNLNYFANNIVKASAHYFVDEKEVCQSVKEEDTAYHCGAKTYKHKVCRNSNSIGIEMCSRKDNYGNYYIKAETIERAVDLIKVLMRKYGISSKNILRHYDVTGKNCPAPFVENETLWKAFLKKIAEADMEVKTIKIKINDKTKTVKAIEKDGYNYVKLQDLRDDRIQISYDKLPIIKING